MHQFFSLVVDHQQIYVNEIPIDEGLQCEEEEQASSDSGSKEDLSVQGESTRSTELTKGKKAPFVKEVIDTVNILSGQIRYIDRL